MQPIIADSARKHGHTETAMLHAYEYPIRVYDMDEGFTMFIGADQTGGLLEVGVVEGDEGPVIVHCMNARQKFLTGGW